jgi:hypothetical protein
MAVILCNIQDNFLLSGENGRVFTHYSELRQLHDSTPSPVRNLTLKFSRNKPNTLFVHIETTV